MISGRVKKLLYYTKIQIDLGTRPFSCSVDTGDSVGGLRRPGHEFDQSYDISGFFRCVVKVFTVLG